MDTAAFSGELSPVAEVTLDDLVNSVANDLRDAISGGSGPVILVGHSSGGFSITPVAERYPEYVGNLVYLAGMMPDVGVTPGQDIFASDNSGSGVLPLLYGDPTQTGALRVDWNSADPTYFAGLQGTFYNDADSLAVRAVANLVSPDFPLQPHTVPTAKTAQRWGSVRRSHIRTNQDHALLPTLQDRWIAEADAFTPLNLTNVYRIDSSHSPFISQPDNLTDILLDIANRSPQ